MDDGDPGCHRKIVPGITMVATCAEHATTKPSPNAAPPLVVLETQALPCEPSFEDAILLAQERDHLGLLGFKPAAYGGDQQLERQHGRGTTRTARRSTPGTLRA